MHGSIIECHATQGSTRCKLFTNKILGVRDQSYWSAIRSVVRSLDYRKVKFKSLIKVARVTKVRTVSVRPVRTFSIFSVRTGQFVQVKSTNFQLNLVSNFYSEISQNSNRDERHIVSKFGTNQILQDGSLLLIFSICQVDQFNTSFIG